MYEEKVLYSRSPPGGEGPAAAESAASSATVSAGAAMPALHAAPACLYITRCTLGGRFHFML